MYNYYKGYWMLVLHAHLPFVRHPEYSDSLEERWLYEGVIDTYIPLLEMFDRLANEDVEFKVTLSLTPPLMNMLDDDFLKDRILIHINKLIELSEKEIKRNKYNEDFFELSKMYYNRFKNILYCYEEKYKKDILKAFKLFQDLGFLEIVTSSATHCYLPLYEIFKENVIAQIDIGVREYRKYFGKYPTGIWNAECGYYNGLENILQDEGIKYFFTDTHTVLNSSERPKYGIFAPLMTENGVVYFGRDFETSRLVWSAKEGYPGNPYYREFYRDIGYDLDFDYIKPYILDSGDRIFTGIKYYRITDKDSPLEYKKPYDIKKASEFVIVDANHFVSSREKQFNYVGELMDRVPLVTSMYDAELFGHWWFEGVDFLYNVIKIINERKSFKMILPQEYLSIYPENQISKPFTSSWGNNGYSEFWLNESNDWIYRHTHKIAERMTKIATEYYNTKNELYIRVLNQMSRELLLAEASDWPFIMKTRTLVEYAKKRVVDSINNFNILYEMLERKKIDEKFLRMLEERNNIFSEMDFRVFAKK